MSAAEDTSDARSRGEEGAGGFTHPGGTRCGRWRAGALRNREGKGEWTLGISRLGRAFAEETLVAILKKGPFVCREAGGGSDSRDGRWTRRRAWTHLDGRKKVVHFDSVALRRGTPLPAAPTAMSPLLAKSIFFVLSVVLRRTSRASAFLDARDLRRAESICRAHSGVDHQPRDSASCSVSTAGEDAPSHSLRGEGRVRDSNESVDRRCFLARGGGYESRGQGWAQEDTDGVDHHSLGPIREGTKVRPRDRTR